MLLCYSVLKSRPMADSTSRRRAHRYARRTCRQCRGDKKRCVLPPSSLDLYPSHEALGSPCARCSSMGAPCVLDDFFGAKTKQQRSIVLKATRPRGLQDNGVSIQVLGYELLLNEIVRQIQTAKPATAAISGRLKTVKGATSIADMDAVIDDALCRRISSW